MKKIIYILICIILIAAFTVAISGIETLPETAPAVETSATPETVGETVAETEADETAPLPEEEPLPDIGEGNNTWAGRIWHYVYKNKDTILGAAGDILIFAVALIIKRKNKKNTGEMLNQLTAVKTDTSGAALSQQSVAKVVNDMIDGYNNLALTYEKYGETEDGRNKVNSAVLVTNTAILEILTTVYANSKNLPTGVKDLINLKYANCLKTLGNDEQLKSVVSMVRESLGEATDKPEDKTEE